ncbi:MAG: DUF4384 domain-containing protein [Gammaproteobacteria bacterium]
MNKRKINRGLRLVWLPMLLVGCGLNPQNADIGTTESLPEAKVTVYQDAINKLGIMTSIYTSHKMKIMAKDIVDNTGTSVATSAEIPRDITEMVKSTLNGIGGNVLYIPYEPEFMQQTVITGYSEYGEKILPEVVLSGGITEFDRGLVTKGDSLDLDIEIGNEYGINFSDQNKASLASVTLDFNLIDFKTFAGIPRIQAINGIKLNKAVKEDSIGFTIKSATFGAKGEIKKVQGRHAAVRLLVQLSMLQLVGRYEKLPYWRLIPGATRDDLVIDLVLADFYAMAPAQQLATIQQYLYLHGYEVLPTGQMDNATQSAIQSFAQKMGLASSDLNQDFYLALYENVPINAYTRQRRKNLDNPDSIMNTQNALLKLPETLNKPKITIDETPATGSLTLTTDKSSYRIGDPLKIGFSVSEPMYVRIVVINSQGQIDTIFPNVYQSDPYCLPGKRYSIPSPGADFSLDIGGPKGVDKLRAVASKTPIPADAMYFTDDGQFDDSKMASYTVRASAEYAIR